MRCPPGLAPLTLSERAMTVIRNRRHPCQSWYLDCSLIGDYWTDTKRTYHHTAPISMISALRESLRVIHEEGLEPRFTRHRLHSDALLAGLQALGFQLLPAWQYHLPPLTCVTLPANVDDGATRKSLLHDYGIEVGGGLGPLSGKVWRIGLMGESSRVDSVLSLLSALEHLGVNSTQSTIPGESLNAAQKVFAQGYWYPS